MRDRETEYLRRTEEAYDFREKLERFAALSCVDADASALAEADLLAVGAARFEAGRLEDIAQARSEYAARCQAWFLRLPAETQALYWANPKRYCVPLEAIPPCPTV